MKRRQVVVHSSVRWPWRGDGTPRTLMQKHSRAIVRAFVESVHALADEDHWPTRKVLWDLLVWTVTGVATLSLTACTPWRMAYLRDAVDHATPDEITMRFGPPLAARELTTGETVWRYQSYQGDLLCLEYILRFDQAKVLRQWTRQGC
jgi:hypothetical protein